MPRELPACAARSKQFSRLRLVPLDARAGPVEHAEFDHRRGGALVGRLAPGADRLHQLPIGGVGAAQLIERARDEPAATLQYLIAVAMSEGATSGVPLTSAGLSGSAGSAASRSAQHEIGGLRVDLRWNGQRSQPPRSRSPRGRCGRSQPTKAREGISS